MLARIHTKPRAQCFEWIHSLKPDFVGTTCRPWYKEVGVLLEQQAYWGWFVPYRDCLTEAGDYICKNPATGEVDAASNLYHDEEQSPGWTDPNHEVPPDTGPDGVCHRDEKGNSGKGCDCGHGVACGKHLWNHKNGSMLRDYLVNHHIAHDLQNPNVDGYYLDDFWTEAAGPSEEAWPCTPRGSGAGKCSNFTAQELKDSVGNWSLTMATAQAKIRSLNGFDWQSFRNVRRPGNSTECTAFLDSACGLGPPAPHLPAANLSAAWIFLIGYNFTADHKVYSLTNFELDLALFLASRQEYWWLGYTWQGCGCGWEYGKNMPCGGEVYQRPPILDKDFGTPLGSCEETSPGSGVYVREWSKSTVTVDCNAYNSSIAFKSSPVRDQ